MNMSAFFISIVLFMFSYVMNCKVLRAAVVDKALDKTFIIIIIIIIIIRLTVSGWRDFKKGEVFF